MPLSFGMTTPGFLHGSRAFFHLSAASGPPGHITVGTADSSRTAGGESAASRTGLFAHPGVGKSCDLRPLYRSIKKRTEPQKAPSAAKKQPICRGSGTAAGQSTLWKIIFSESLYSDTWKYQAITSSEEVSVSI